MSLGNATSTTNCPFPTPTLDDRQPQSRTIRHPGADATRARQESRLPQPQSNPGEQCDKSPFSSTKEGAGKGDGNFSVRYVRGAQNGSAGTKLAVWYGQDRILDGDGYGIWVS
ncbi:NucA/NucB deoxyribonuclease domain-containing protein [Streptomyces sp. NPDC056500]|uniref:NucA/NucB deoxyribonuclease domain-containing protein n=1 Tax=Streptomyces sp. NPDC056500 TaxID=3345840 RepID=UPI0036A58652